MHWDRFSENDEYDFVELMFDKHPEVARHIALFFNYEYECYCHPDTPDWESLSRS